MVAPMFTASNSLVYKETTNKKKKDKFSHLLQLVFYLFSFSLSGWYLDR